jgi:plastocyanin
MIKRLTAGVVVSAALMVGAAACGGGGESGSGQSAAPSTPAAASPAAGAAAPAAPAGAPQAAAEVQTLTVNSGDYWYDPKEITVRPGTIRLTLTNTGPERPHTIAVKNRSGQGDLVRSERAPVGGAASIEFTVSEEGAYQLYCTLPGHADRGQVGTLNVRRAG